MATSSRVPRTRWAKFRRYIRLVATFLFSHIGLCILVMGYALLGAALFQWLESDNARKARRHINLEKQNLVLKLWNITYLPMLLRADVWKQQASGNLREFTASMVQLVQKRGYDGMDEEAEATQWDFMGSLLYSIIIMTTIGYGDIAPKTVGGRMVTIFYAIIGIPLMLVFMNNIGNVLASSFKFLYWKICCQYCFDGRRRRSKKSRKKNRPGSGQRSPVIDGEVIRISREDAKQASKVPIIPNKYVDDDPDNNQRLGSRKTKVKSKEIKRLSSRRFKGREKQSQLQQLKSISPTKTASTTTTTTVQIQQPISTIQALAFQYENSDDISSDESEDEDDGNIPILVCLIIVVCYICLGALLFREFEDWPFGDSAYFCFITLTTIGFGDFVPQGIKTRSTDQKQIINRVYSALYLLFGMALMAMSFNVIKESVINTFRALGKKIGLVKGGKGCY